jgi:hypothetical protein
MNLLRCRESGWLSVADDRQPDRLLGNEQLIQAFGLARETAFIFGVCDVRASEGNKTGTC